MQVWSHGGVTYRATPRATATSQGMVGVAGKDWDPASHPRDRNGRFIHVGAVVQLLDGQHGTVTATSGHRVRVRVPGERRERVMRSRAVRLPESAAETEAAQAAHDRARMAADQARLDKHPERAARVAEQDRQRAAAMQARLDRHPEWARQAAERDRERMAAMQARIDRQNARRARKRGTKGLEPARASA